MDQPTLDRAEGDGRRQATCNGGEDGRLGAHRKQCPHPDYITSKAIALLNFPQTDSSKRDPGIFAKSDVAEVDTSKRKDQEFTQSNTLAEHG